IRASGAKGLVGWAPCGIVKMPAALDPPNVEAARRAMFAVDSSAVWNNAWWYDPALLGKYPEDGLALFGKDAPRFTDADMKTIRQPLDFLGLNIYHGQTVEAGPDGKPRNVARPAGAPTTAFDWPVTPECLYWGPKFMAERYRLPIFITENGMANCDWVARDGGAHDPQRIDYLARHVGELGRAVADGVDVRGYFVWSILDNFEWAEGYTKRFGLVHVDYATQKRTLKDSAKWYQALIASNGTEA
ncbi:family 1 glycosylhydrolase, partial [Candidatus Sumerlaeota bacterium]|nr:family 1 glycosylhydrolase [Candidatus Sumerlaeota bacterium]